MTDRPKLKLVPPVRQTTVAEESPKVILRKSGVRGGITPDKRLSPANQAKMGLALTEKEYLMHAFKVREALSVDVFNAAAYILRNCVKTPPKEDIELKEVDCQFVLWKFVQRLLDQDGYEAAAMVLWGPDLFTPEPHSTQLVWNGLREHAKNLVMGGGSLSKSYSGAVYFSLEWLRDPEWTCIKVLSVTRTHAATNIFAHIKNLLQNTIIKIPNLAVKSETIRVNADEKQGIHLSSIPQGETGKGRLRGFHPTPRTAEHPTFGKLSRVFLLLDEAEEIPEGVWEDVNNVLITEEVSNSHVKIFAATNPKDRQSRFARLAEPVAGWSSVDIDIDETWESQSGYNVIRLDGARCENVEQRRVVFPGLQTWEGFERLLKLGADNPEYYTMARGWFPESSASVVIVAPNRFASSKGLITFSGPTTSVAGVDLAFEGGDSVIFTGLRIGLAIGWTNAMGEYQKYASPRRAVQVEQQFALEKRDTVEQSKAIIRLCKDFGVKPRWLGVDRTGSGTGVHDTLMATFGRDVFGIMFSWAATDSYILEDDTEACNERYDDLITEMAHSIRKFMEADVLKLNPAINWNALENDTVTRRYRQVGRGMLRLESKGEFKKRHSGRSPDRFDSLMIALHTARMNAGLSGRLVENPIQSSVRPDAVHHGVVDELHFIDMS